MPKLVILLMKKKSWNLDSLANILPQNIIKMIRNTPSPITITDYKMYWKFTSIGQFSIKSATWPNNTTIEAHPKAKTVYRI